LQVKRNNVRWCGESEDRVKAAIASLVLGLLAAVPIAASLVVALTLGLGGGMLVAHFAPAFLLGSLVLATAGVVFGAAARSRHVSKRYWVPGVVVSLLAFAPSAWLLWTLGSLQAG
jgi:hypothetical protein